MTAGISVALVGKGTSGELADYLTNTGFDVHTFDVPPRAPDAACSLVWLADSAGSTEEVVKGVRVWLGTQGPSRAVVITSRPAVFRIALDGHGDRVVVLVSPIFAWQVVDALRGVHVLEVSSR
jgi:hypothetical protein